MSSQKIALVTGASSGIGAEIARHLKKEEGVEIWLVARREDRLQALSRELESQGAQTRLFVLNLQLKDSWKILEDEFQKSNKELMWLVNNAGFGYSGLFEEQSLDNLEGMIDLNIGALTSVTRRMLPFMKKGSHIVNIASSIGFIPVAGYAVYCATKAYVLNFSLALRAELKSKGISVSAVCPGPVATEFFDISAMGAPPKFIVEDCVNTAFLAVEKSGQAKAVIVTGFAAWMARFFGAILPRSWIAMLSLKALKKKV